MDARAANDASDHPKILHNDPTTNHHEHVMDEDEPPQGYDGRPIAGNADAVAPDAKAVASASFLLPVARPRNELEERAKEEEEAKREAAEQTLEPRKPIAASASASRRRY
jgi:hypothetical protein